MTTIPTLDKISGNTVMQKFRSLAKAVIETLTSFGEQTDYIITDLAPRLEENLTVLTTKLSELNDTLNTVSELAGRVDAVLDVMVTTDTIQNITALKTFSGGLAVVGATNINGEVQITNGHDLAVAGNVDCANEIASDTLLIREQGEIAGMAFEKNGTQTVLSNDNGIVTSSPVVMGNLDATVPTTETGVRDTKAANGTRIQNDLDAYLYMMRTTGNQVITGTKSFMGLVLDDKAYIKNSNNSTFVPLIKLTTSTLNDGYFELSMLASGRGVSLRGIRLIWNKENATLTKTVDIGEDFLTYYVAIDTDGNYWVCAGINNNQAIFLSNIRFLRNAGFADYGMTLTWTGTSPDISSWTIQAVTQ